MCHPSPAVPYSFSIGASTGPNPTPFYNPPITVNNGDVVRIIDPSASITVTPGSVDVSFANFKGRTGPTGPTGSGSIGPTGPTGPGSEEPSPFATQIIYVNKGGNDVTGDGSEHNPFLTVTRGMTAINDSSVTKRYAISIGPETYTEGLIHLKANVQLVGTSTMLTRLAIPFDINDPTWIDLTFADNRSGFVDLTLLSAPLVFDFAQAMSSGGKLFFVSVTSGPRLGFIGFSASVNEINIRDSQLNGGYGQTGANMTMLASYSAGDINIDTAPPNVTFVMLILKSNLSVVVLMEMLL